ncbi:hypothetical protein [Steroidobacter cummioxidans]|uniref:hypothetical protein n=1 Tax=Steroidobacter cummioxidans TaxID=1803913 RepID=UPI000E322538|nr:hypothetical protein [Steroidobacter cummioxidans]
MKIMKLLLFGIFIASSVPTVAVAECCLNVTVEISIQEGAASSAKLKAIVRNNSTSSIEINSSSLPWGGRYSTILAAVRESSPNEPLDQRFPIDDLGPETIHLKPGAKIEGQIEMHDFFKDMDKALQKDNLIVLWSYKLVAVDGKESKRLAGWVRVPRRH